MGLGIVVMPLFLGAEAIMRGELKIVLPDWQPEGGNIVALYRQTRRASPVIQALVNEVAEKLGPEPEWENSYDWPGCCPSGTGRKRP